MTSEFKKRDFSDSMVQEKLQIIITLIFSNAVNTPNGPVKIDETIQMISYDKKEEVEISAFSGDWAKFKGQVVNPQTGELDLTMRFIALPKNVIKYIVIQPPPSGLTLAKAGAMPMGGTAH